MSIVRSLASLGIAAIALLGVTTVNSAVSGSQQGATIVRVVPPSTSISRSTHTFDVRVDVENVSNLGGFEFILVVDSSVLRPTRALKTIFLGQSGREIYCPDATIEDSAIRYACVTLREQPAGVDGSGTLATVTFETVGTGSTDLVLKRVKLVHPDGTEIEPTPEDAKLSVTGDSWWSQTHVLLISGGAVIVLLVAAGAGLRLRARARRSGGDALE